MHESQLARNILETALAHAGATARVRAVRAFVAETESLSRDALALQFAAHARGTRAEGARLEIELRHVQACCTACGHVYLPEHHVLLCPRCDATAAELDGETGLRIEEIDVDDA